MHITYYIGPVSCVAISGDSSLLVSGSLGVEGPSSVKVWTMNDGICLRTFVGHIGAVYCITTSPCSRYVASGGGDKTIRIWGIVSGEPSRVLRGHKGPHFPSPFLSLRD